MLLAEASTELLYAWDQGLLKSLPETLLQDRLPIMLTQILNRTLLTQTTRGAWGFEERPETTSYGVLTLMALSSLPWHAHLREVAISAAISGKTFLERSHADWTTPAFVWIEKVTYGSARLSLSYCLAAMKATERSNSWSKKTNEILNISEKSVSKIVELLSTLDSFQSEPRWKLVASAVEVFAFLPQLKSVGDSMLPGQKGAKNEYLAYIPVTWIVVNYHKQLFLSANLLWDMMVLTICNFRVDEYMESVVGKLPNNNLEPILSLIDDVCQTKQPPLPGSESKYVENGDKRIHSANHLRTKIEAGANGTERNPMDRVSNKTFRFILDSHERDLVSPLTDVRTQLDSYAQAILTYPRIREASASDQSHLRHALCAFLRSHVAQIADNADFARQSPWSSSTPSVLTSARQSFYTWVHTTGAESVSCPFSLAFLTCLLGAASTPENKRSEEPAADCFGSTRRKYLAGELCTHLAVMSRLYNDYGSVERDRIEANVNSINFPDFHGSSSRTAQHIDSAEHETKLKEELLELAKVERRSADVASEALLSDLEGNLEAGGGRKMKDKANAAKLFIGVTRLYADLYVARDLSNRVVSSTGI